MVSIWHLTMTFRCKLMSNFGMHWFDCPFTHVSTLNIWFSVAHTIINNVAIIGWQLKRVSYVIWCYMTWHVTKTTLTNTTHQFQCHTKSIVQCSVQVIHTCVMRKDWVDCMGAYVPLGITIYLQARGMHLEYFVVYTCIKEVIIRGRGGRYVHDPYWNATFGQIDWPYHYL